MAYFSGYVVIFGGGAVGNSCVSLFKANNWWVACIEPMKSTSSLKENIDQQSASSTLNITNQFETKNLSENSKLANLSILTNPFKDICEQESEIMEEISKAIDGKKLNAVICVASDFTEGNAKQDLSAKMDLMWKQNVWPSILSTSIAVAHMGEGGFLCLPGARSALEGTPSTIGYGLAKAAVHQLTKSLALEGSALPTHSVCVALLPITIDTVIQKQAMTEVDVSAWTPTKYITDLLYKWSIGTDRPENGSFIQFITRDFNTEISIIAK